MYEDEELPEDFASMFGPPKYANEEDSDDDFDFADWAKGDLTEEDRLAHLARHDREMGIPAESKSGAEATSVAMSGRKPSTAGNGEGDTREEGIAWGEASMDECSAASWQYIHAANTEQHGTNGCSNISNLNRGNTSSSSTTTTSTSTTTTTSTTSTITTQTAEELLLHLRKEGYVILRGALSKTHAAAMQKELSRQLADAIVQDSAQGGDDESAQKGQYQEDQDSWNIGPDGSYQRGTGDTQAEKDEKAEKEEKDGTKRQLFSKINNRTHRHDLRLGMDKHVRGAIEAVMGRLAGRLQSSSSGGGGSGGPDSGGGSSGSSRQGAENEKQEAADAKARAGTYQSIFGKAGTLCELGVITSHPGAEQQDIHSGTSRPLAVFGVLLTPDLLLLFLLLCRACIRC
jgi:hypothetical protein